MTKRVILIHNEYFSTNHQQLLILGDEYMGLGLFYYF